MAQEIQVKDWRSYAELLANGNLELLTRNLDDNIIYRIKAALLGGGTSGVIQWQSAPDDPYENGYPEGFIVEYTNQLWKSGIDDNLGNPPSDGSLVWTEVSAAGNGIDRYVEDSVFIYDPSLTVKDDSLYLLSESQTLPFQSTDFDAELLAGDWVIVGGQGAELDSELGINIPSLATPSGVPTNQEAANQEYTANIEAILAELARIASASAAIIADPLPTSVTTAETQLDFTTTSPSTDQDIIEVDDTDNDLALKKVGRYTWLTSLEAENTSNNTDHTLTIRTRKVSDDSLLTEREVSLPRNNVRTDFRAVFYDILDGEEPVELYISLESTSDTSVILNKFETTLAYGGSGAGTNTDEFVKTSVNDTTAGYLSIKSLFGDEFESTIQNPSGSESLLTTFKGWIYNALRTFKLINDADSLTADRTITWQDKSGSPALLEDIQSVEKSPFTETIDIDTLLQHSPDYTQTSELNLVRGNNNYIGGTYQVLIRTNGQNINTSGDIAVLSNEYSANVASVYLFIFAQLSNNTIGLTITDTRKFVNSPIIRGYEVGFNNAYIDILFNRGVYGANDATTPVALGDLIIANFVPGGVTAVSITSLTNQTDTALTGGENVIRCVLSITGDTDGTESFEIKPSGIDVIFDANGAAMPESETTGNIKFSTLLFSDTFDGTVIDTNKWVVTQVGTDITQNDALLLDRNSTDAWSIISNQVFEADDFDILVFNTKIKTSITSSSKIFFGLRVSPDAVRWALGFSSEGEVAANAESAIEGVSNDIGVVLPTPISAGIRLKTVIDITNTTVRYYAWDNGWVDLGVLFNKTYTGAQFKVEFTRNDTVSVADIMEVDDLYVTSDDYTTELP